MKKLIARLSVIIAAVVMLIGSTGALNVAAATKIPQTVTVPSSADTGMKTPTGIGTSGPSYTTPLNWAGNMPTTNPALQVAYLQSGQYVQIRTAFNNANSDLLGYQSILKIGGGTPTYTPSIPLFGTPSWSVNPDDTAQANVSVQKPSSSQPFNENMGYKITAPTVLFPEWMSFQSSVQINKTHYYSTIFHILVFPKNFAPTVNAPATIFAGNTGNVTTTPAIDGVQLGFNIDNISGGSWSGNTVTATDAGATNFEATLNLPPAGAGTTSLSFASPVQQIVFFNINSPTVDEGSNATFNLTNGGDATFTNVKWTVNGLPVTGIGKTLTLPNVTYSDNGAKVTATFDVVQNGNIVQTGATGTATLTVNRLAASLSIAPNLIFAGSDVPTGSNQAKAQMMVNGKDLTSQTVWQLDDGNLATVNGAGLINANLTGATGTVNLTGKATVNGLSKTATGSVIVGRLADPGVATIGSTTTLNAPTATGSKWVYQWQRMAKGSTTWSNIQNANQATFTTPALTSDDDGAQYRVQVTMADTAKTVVTSNPVTLNVRAAGLSLLSVPDFQFKTMSGDANVGQLLKGQFDGSITDFNDRNLPTKWLIQGNPNATPVVMSNQQANPNQTNMQLSVAVAPFLNNGHPLSNAGSTAKMMLYWDDGTGTMVQKYAPDDNSQVNLYGNPGFDPLTGEASRKVSALLSIGPSPQAQPGTYTSQMTWTLTAGPTPQ